MPGTYSSDAFEAAYTYAGNDLGAVWRPDKTAFRVWAPTARAVTVNLYRGGAEGADDLLARLPMTPDVNGTWTAEQPGDLNGVYYTYTAQVDGRVNETIDPYARTAGVNGRRGMVIDLRAADPEGWQEDRNPNADLSCNDAVIYELHLRDLSVHESSGIQNPGKFLGLAERGTVTPGGVPTGLDHIRNLGVTHVHLLPLFDYGSVDEERLDTPQFNWGYDPVNYNVPEGSYATDPYHGQVRVREMKQMVKALHENGLSVVMDVVYNHVYHAEQFCFEQLVPGYFFRTKENGVYSNASGCGNDVATERSMVRKYIVDSVKYWAEEYHIDGFRFDLAGLMDIGTVNEIVATVRRTRPDVIFYGEGWHMDTAVTKPGVLLATQGNSPLTPAVAYFNDGLRDALRGNGGPGYVSGAGWLNAAVRQGLTGMNGWCAAPAQCVNYASCHDNHTLMDYICLFAPQAPREKQIRMNNLAAAIYFTAQGIPFLQAGEEMLRTKRNSNGSLNENSYNAPDAVNSLKWHTLEDAEYRQVYEYYRGLIAFRKAHAALRLRTAEEVSARLSFVSGLPEGGLAFQLRGEGSGDLFLIFNPADTPREVPLPEGLWDVCVQGQKAGTLPLRTVERSVTAEPISAAILVKR